MEHWHEPCKNKNNNDVSPALWEEHFKNLMQKNVQPLNDKEQKIIDFVSTEENWNIFNELSFKISDIEISTAIKKF